MTRSVALSELNGYGRFIRDMATGTLPSGLGPVRHPEQAQDRVDAFRGRPRFPITPELAATLHFEHRRLQAGVESLENIERLAAGAARVVLTGQQPGLFGGPLYTKFKVATAVALARRLSAELGEPVVPVYWNAADDADFDEAARGTLAGSDLRLLRLALPAEARVPRAWIGDLPSTVIEAVLELIPAPADADPRGAAWRAWLARVVGAGDDFGRMHGAAVLSGFESDGLVIVDARWPELRRAAAGLFDRYLDEVEPVRADILAAGRGMAAAGYEPPLGDDAAAMALFITPERARLRLTPGEVLAEARRLLPAHPGHLSPNVVLRPLVCDTVFPTVAHVTGPGETQYMAQLHDTYRRLGVERPLVVDRLFATVLPAAGQLVAGSNDEALRLLLNDPGDVLRAWHERRMPPELAGAIDEGRRRLAELFDDLREPSRRLDSSLEQILESAREKALFQFERLPEGAGKKVRQKSEAAHPGLAGLAEFLRPRSRLQERELSALNIDLFLGSAATARLAALAGEHLEELYSGRRRHYIVDV